MWSGADPRGPAARRDKRERRDQPADAEAGHEALAPGVRRATSRARAVVGAPPREHRGARAGGVAAEEDRVQQRERRGAVADGSTAGESAAARRASGAREP